MTRTLLFLIALVALGGCTSSKPATAGRDPALAERIERLVEKFLTSDDEQTNAAVLSDARAIFERDGIPSVAQVGDAPAYGFVLVNMLGQPPDVRLRFFSKVREAAASHDLPEDALVFAEARRRHTEAEERARAHGPSHPELRDQISRLFKDDQAVREKDGFDLEKMRVVDRRIADPLKAIFDRYGVPTYDMVGMQAAKDFVTMVQHQSPEFRVAVLPKLKANVDAGQAEPESYSMVYDRSQRDQGRNQLYGQQLECASGKALEVAPIDDEKNVDMRRAELGLMRLALYARLVRLSMPDMCGQGSAAK